MISIVTVNYNSKSELEKTLNTIGNQNGNNVIEVIVVDGGSSDGSQLVVKEQFSDLVDVLISERDAGIYDAMNKGIKCAKFDWIYFLNAGDCFASDDVLSKVIELIKNNVEYNFIYAPYISDGKIDDSQQLTIDYLTSHMINHQSILFNKELFDEYLYDTSYRYCADYAHLLKAFKRLKSLKADFVIANYDSNGISSSEENKSKMWKERLRAIIESQLPVVEKLLLSRRGVIAYPYHLMKGFISPNERKK
ncbi:glycosyltransferase [Citrobacter sp. Ct235]|uniref:glycosyltransferase family 2 protein n=1 Tax=Citrobacter sp. Ct235 TaxID=2985157 RepID=UPI002576DC1E|nr:glycosyltransferase family 2 protein [Citrobacter sp. Ct235]MDM2738341.1 glycosyltransferase [Citrobacter sp. Ct235]